MKELTNDQAVDEKERQEAENSRANALFEKVKAGLMSTAEFKNRTGRRIRMNGEINYSKYSHSMMRVIRAKNGVGGPTAKCNWKQANQMNALHDAWYKKKFG